MINLSQDIKYLQGVGPQKAALLDKELGIKTLSDLLVYYPYRYIDKSQIHKISDIDGNMPYVQLVGQILSTEEYGTGRSKRLVSHFSDGTGVIDLVWFQGLKYVAKTIEAHKIILIFGKPSIFNGHLQIPHPEIEDAPPHLKEIVHSSNNLFEQNQQHTTMTAQPSFAFKPLYNTTDKMKKGFLSSSVMAKITANLFKLLSAPFAETMPQYIVERHKLISYDEAIRNIHFPTTPEMLRKAQLRLKFEELFYVQLNILRYAKDRQLRYKGHVFNIVGDIFNNFYSNYLPFQLTGAQKRVIKEVRADMKSGRQMNRLVQGDVGSGKTLVALMCALIALDNGYQACIMAPTEILAEQHLETLKAFLRDMPVNVQLLTGSVKGKKRTELLQSLLNGDINILVGTHAVIEDNVVFHRLGLVVIDEQHRFGVAQRAKLWQKNEIPPHVLVMTATPIPRTLAMTLYGDLDVSIIDELPPGRKPIKTIHRFDAHREQIYSMMRHELELGRQIYIVYPLIQEKEKYTPVSDGDYSFESRDGANILSASARKKQETLDMKNLEDGYKQICTAFPEYRVSKVHGKLKPAEKDIEMDAFASGRTQILVATTVIEVGVNVPNASVMIIENAERFGLSQLHQLRGRVGRGADQSYCVLVTNYKISDTTRKRIQIMVDSTDGFQIAEEDLKLRGPGDLEGTQQSGMAFDLKIANLARDGQILSFARMTAQEVIDNDPDETNPQNAVLWRRLREIRKSNINWGAIS
ncbi:MAG: ATP-dependent DNA helicase RecG [Bacteroidaceae bacterium]|nr:ATP-dependent DNA helicase RecG [Bacteroidaceae bacterium]